MKALILRKPPFLRGRLEGWMHGTELATILRPSRTSGRRATHGSSYETCRWLCGGGLDLHVMAHVLEAPEEALGLCGLGTAVEMVCTEILIDGSIFEHVE